MIRLPGPRPWLRTLVRFGLAGRAGARRRVGGLQYYLALRAAVEDLARTQLADRDGWPREALATGNTLAPKSLCAGQARSIDEREVTHGSTLTYEPAISYRPAIRAGLATTTHQFRSRLRCARFQSDSNMTPQMGV